MMKKMNRSLIITTLICICPLILSLAFYQQLPEIIAIQWNRSGEVTNTAPKWLGIFGFPLFLALINVIVYIAVENDPKRKNVNRTLKGLSHWIIAIVSVLCQLVIYAGNLGVELNFSSAANMLLGILFVMIGNYLPKCRQNYTVGFKVPWTLHDEDNWNKTHRMAGYLWVAGGLMIIINVVLRISVLYRVILVVIVFVPIIYSFLFYRKKGIYNDTNKS